MTIEKAHDMLRQARFLHVRGPAQLSRWDAFHTGWGDRRKELSLLSVLLISYGLKTGFLQCNSAAKYSEDQLPQSREDQSETMTGETKAALFRRCKNKLHCVAVALGNRNLIADINGWFFLSSPLSAELHAVRTMSKGTSGAKQVHLREASGASLKVANQIMENVLSAEHWSVLGLWSGEQLHGAYVQEMRPDHPECRLQDARWARWQQVGLNVMQQVLIYGSASLYGYPQKLILLACGTEQQQNECLVHLRDCFEAHQLASRTNTKWCKGFLKRSPFNFQVMKDLIRALEKSSWQLTKEILDWLAQIHASFGLTWNEEAFGKARGREESENRKHEFSDVDVWQTLSFSGVLKSAGFKEVEADADQIPVEWPDSLFHIHHRQAHPELKAITGKLSWPSLTQLSICGLACELAVLVEAMKRNEVPNLWLGIV